MDHLRLVFMDHRGFAPSPGPVDNSEFELEKLVDDVERLRKELDLGRVAVIGHSGHANARSSAATHTPSCT
jgi:proline iminopeptidase